MYRKSYYPHLDSGLSKKESVELQYVIFGKPETTRNEKKS